MNFKRNISRDVALLERNHDRLLLACIALVDVTNGNFKERVHAINLIHEINKLDDDDVAK